MAREERLRLRLSWELAWRYLRRHPRRGRLAFTTLVSVAGVALGVAALVIVMSVLSGLGEFISESVLAVETPLVITHETSGSFFLISDAALRDIEAVAGVEALSPYVEGEAILRHPRSRREASCRLRGVDPVRDPALVTLGEKTVYGETDLAPDNGIPGLIAGLYLAEQLAHPTGDTLLIFPPEAFFSSRGFFVGRAVLTGAVETGLPANDKILAYVPIELAQALLGADGGLSGISVVPTTGSKPEELRDRLFEVIPDTLTVTTWQERNPSLSASLQLEKLGSFAAILLITLVASFNILGTVSRSVVERRRDIAILKAMGAQNGLILRVFLWEGLLVGAVGVVLGLALGLSGCYILSSTDLIALPDVYSFHEHIPVKVAPPDVAAVAIAAMFLSVASAFVPARKASSLNPIRGLQS
jgi:lipoprotein-releasing system permease protein